MNETHSRTTFLLSRGIPRVFAVLVAMAFSYAALAAWAAVSDIPARSKWSGQIKQCNEAKEGAKRSIEEFVCPSNASSRFDEAYQVVLDLEFREIDKEVKTKIKELWDTKGKNVAQYSQIISNWFDETSSDATFANKYRKICQGKIVEEVSKHYGNISSDHKIPIYTNDTDAAWNACLGLMKNKLNAYRWAAWTIAEKNVTESYQIDKKEFFTDLKDKYRKVIEKWMVLIGQYDVIYDKWTNKTKVHNGQ